MALEKLGFRWFHWAIAAFLFLSSIGSTSFGGPVALVAGVIAMLVFSIGLVYAGRRVWHAPAAFRRGREQAESDA